MRRCEAREEISLRSVTADTQDIRVWVVLSSTGRHELYAIGDVDSNSCPLNYCILINT